jgi:hypothetical protein
VSANGTRASALIGTASLVLAVLALTAAGRSAAADGLRYDVQFNDALLTQSQASLTLGDRIIMNDVLLQDGSAVGYASGLCTITDTAGVEICNVTFVLSDGTISAQFANTPPPEKLFAIAAGTGAYLGAEGHGILVEAGDETGTLTFYFSD